MLELRDILSGSESAFKQALRIEFQLCFLTNPSYFVSHNDAVLNIIRLTA